MYLLTTNYITFYPWYCPALLLLTAEERSYCLSNHLLTYNLNASLLTS